VEQVEAVLELSDSSSSDDEDEDTSAISGLYTCIANNNVGNVTMTVVVPSQPSPPPFLRNPDSLQATDARRLSSTATTRKIFAASTTPAILQSILLGDSLLQLQRLAASNAPASPPPYSLLAGTRLRNHSTAADLAQTPHQHQVPVASSRARLALRQLTIMK